MEQHSNISKARRGSVLIYTIAMMPLILLILALSVDFGRIIVARSELDTAVTAAVRAGGLKILEGATYTQVVGAAKGVAEENRVDNFGITVPNGQIRTGVYVPATKQFFPTADMTLVNAIRVTVSHSFDNSTMPLFFWRYAGNGADKTLTTTRTIMVSDVPVAFVNKTITTSTPPTTITTPGTTATNTTNNTVTKTSTNTNSKSNPGKQTKPSKPKTNTSTNTNTSKNTTNTSKTTTTSTPAKTTTTPGTTTTTTITQQVGTGKKFLQQVD